CDPIAFFTRGRAIGGTPRSGDRLLLMHPTDGHALASAGTAWALEATGDERFGRAATAWRDLFADALVDGPASAGAAGPLLLGGFSFDPRRPRTQRWSGYPDGLLVLPRYLLTRQEGKAWLTLTTVMGPQSDPAAQSAALMQGYRT